MTDTTAAIARRLADLAAFARTAREDGTGRATIRPLFAADPGRFARMSNRVGPLLLDRSKTSLDDAAMAALLGMAAATDVAGQARAMAAGEAVNSTEGRAVLHIALRAPRDAGFRVGAEDASAEVADTLDAMRAFCAAVHDGTLRGATGKRFTNVLNIGIGGSDLGPFMAVRALWTEASPMRPYFIANVDGHAWLAATNRLDPETTLVLVASKTFTTAETMQNANKAREWIAGAVGEAGVGAHFAALSTNLSATAAFGIVPARVFGFRDWVGGRFSLWSAIGLSIALTCGWDAFTGMLDGARALDEHALSAPDAENLPLLLALVEVWHVNALGYPARAVLPYDARLGRLPAHLQQVEMESLGKRVGRDGVLVPYATGPVVFGEPGTNAQHSFMQLLHQGTTPVPADIILVAAPEHGDAASHRMLLANGLAQAEALLVGRDLDQVRAEMVAAGLDAAEVARLAPHRVFPGDRPSVAILLDRLNPYTLGMMIALYEYKVFYLGALWGVNAFDQYGVELGKVLASQLLPEVTTGAKAGGHDGSTAGLIAEIRGAWSG
ncbi:glucose-6-phosphate isomerase [Humitalea sp. 24SJ18S-53]|uniref:glucose-6-phosphate isomerase n=1 Tax=Humitalea sp. 24SJ18S-53 TaxID=3422307 RepID=UPI003D670C28